MAWEYNKTNFDRSLAVVIGIDSYKNHPQIHRLRTPVNDAKALADLLETEYEYKPENVIRLLDEAATLTGLQTLLDDTLPNQLKPTKGDRLIFYFAGHGIPRNSQEGPKGYLVPQDADWQKEGSFLAMSEVYEALKKLECHHLLVILDCCFAGTFRWEGRRKIIPILETVRREHYDRFIRYPAWQVITSAAHDQEALDVAKLAQDKRGAIPDEKQELHSPFALALLEGLRENKADLIPDGVITAHELYVYLEQQVSKLSGSRQKPGIYPMRLEYDRGEFVFTKPGFTSEQLKPAPLLNESNNPYRGLASFDEKHANFFFGRKILVEELQHRLSQPNRSLTVVLGVSGSGKSSLVKAGLIPELRQESKWYILDPIRPDRYPFTALARAILPIAQPELIEQLSQVSFLDEVFKPKEESGQDKGDESTDTAFVKLAEFWNSATPEAQLLVIEDYFKQLQDLCRNSQQEEQLSQLYRAIFEQLESLSNRLQNSRQHLTRVIRKWSETHLDVKLLLTIDQFEELITMSQESQTETHGGDRQQSDRAAESQPWLPFLQVLREAIVECSQQLHIVLTLRSDFEPRFLSSPLSAYWKDARFPVRAMNLDELRQAIEGPALKQALYFEPPELVGKLIDEVGQMPGALPLLSFTLSELYIKLYDRWTKDNATDRALRIKDYEELGGVAGALTRRATEEYDNLIRDFGEESGKAYQATMRRVMLRMVTIEGGGVARRRVPESELVYPDSEENKRVAQVSDRLVKARLLVKGQETGEPYVEPAHDFLVRGWDKLQEWIKEEQGNLALQQRLTPAANDWHNSEHPLDLLWMRDPRLAILEEEVDYGNWLNQREMEFVQASISQKQSELDEAEERVQISETRQVNAELREKAIRVSNLLTTQPQEALKLTIQATGENLEKLPELLDVIQASLQGTMETCLLPNFLKGHTFASVAISADGNTIVSVSVDVDNNVGVGYLWNGQGISIGKLQGYAAFNANPPLAISASGEIIIIGEQNVIRLWNRQGRETIQLHGHTEPITSVAMSADGGTIVSSSRDNSVRLWNSQGQEINQLYGHTKAISAVAISADGQVVVTGSSDSKVRIYNQGELVKTFEKHIPIIQANPTNIDNVIQSLAVSANGETIVSCGYDASWLWNKQGSLEKQIEGYPAAITADGEMIVTSSKMSLSNAVERNRLFLWDRQGNPIRELRVGQLQHQESDVVSIAVSANGEVIVAAGVGTIGIWNRQSSTLAVFKGHTDAVTAVAVSHDSQTIISGGKDGTIRLWDRYGNQVEPIQKYNNPITSVATSADGQVIVSGEKGIVCLWDRQSNSRKQFSPRQSLEFGSVEDSIVAVSDDGETIVSCRGDFPGLDIAPDDFQWLRLWNKQGNLLKRFKKHLGFVTVVAISTDGQTIISGSNQGTVCLWDVQKPDEAPLKFNGHRGTVSSVAISNDGHTIASGGQDRQVYIWNKEGNRLAQCPGHEREVTSVAISADGEVIVSGSRDGTIRLWNKQGRPLTLLRGHKSDVLSVAISADGETVVSGGEDKTVRLWRVDWQKFLKICCNRLANYYISNSKINVLQGICKTCVIYAWDSQDLITIFTRQGKSETEVKELTASALIEKGKKLAQLGRVKEAITAFEEAQNINLKVEISADAWGTLGWFGCLYGYVTNPKILVACEKAVNAEPSSGRWHDVRGLAKALTGQGHFAEAIEDFQAFVAWTTDIRVKLHRKRWINALRQGKNPFTQKELLRLVRQQRIAYTLDDEN